MHFFTAEFEHIGDMTIFHGPYDDDEEGARQERHVVSHPSAKWPHGVIPYELSDQFRRELVMYPTYSDPRLTKV